jgi:hypothetical protein
VQSLRNFRWHKGDAESIEPSTCPAVMISISVLPQKLHHLLFFIQRSEERYTLLALSFVKVLYEFDDVSFAELLARFQVGRTSQNCQLLFGQTVTSLFARHFSFP